MAVFQCKMCTGELELHDDGIAQCLYCGTKQTVPVVKDESIQNLFNRANLLRSKNEFDKAEDVYEKIIQSDEKQAEAYWGTVLCKYGIEYVEDEKTSKRIPTCHRTSLEPIIADEDYKCALKYANAVQKALYETEASQIDKIQKEILSIAQNEKPYDVFICYKEKDFNGNRTQDSVIANDIYHQLTQEGLHVFFAAISLEDNLGSAYEPIIFAALNSAKVMLAIGTNPAYFNAVWVKNEWARFLKMMKNDRSKMLIPCFRDMDAYELPEEFAHLQAQDMSKIGFIPDIVRGIKKVVKTENTAAPVQKEIVVSENTKNSDIKPLLRRAQLFLEDGDFSKAEQYAEKVLDANPECADAYMVKLLCEFKAKNIGELCSKGIDFSNNANYKKIVRFADDKTREELAKLEQIKPVFTKPKKTVAPSTQATHVDSESDKRLLREIDRLLAKNPRDPSIDFHVKMITDENEKKRIRAKVKKLRSKIKITILALIGIGTAILLLLLLLLYN